MCSKNDDTESKILREIFHSYATHKQIVSNCPWKKFKNKIAHSFSFNKLILLIDNIIARQSIIDTNFCSVLWSTLRPVAVGTEREWRAASSEQQQFSWNFVVLSKLWLIAVQDYRETQLTIYLLIALLQPRVSESHYLSVVESSQWRSSSLAIAVTQRKEQNRTEVEHSKCAILILLLIIRLNRIKLKYLSTHSSSSPACCRTTATGIPEESIEM